jgi:hypothetical protein
MCYHYTASHEHCVANTTNLSQYKGTRHSHLSKAAITTWHRESCKHPDVYPAGDSCYCSGCDTLAPLDQVVPDETRFIPTLPEPDHHEFHLAWPESVEF